MSAQDPSAGAAVARRVTELLAPHLKRRIAGYMTLGDELDCQPALAALHAAGVPLALPVTGLRGDELVFRSWRPGDDLDSGPFGTRHPPPRAEVVTPDVLLVPLLAFDASGHRLGYGAGFYDRTIAALRSRRPTLAIGLAYDGQELPKLPAEGTDQRLDAIVTEARVIQIAQPWPVLR
jgi:5-formyltetrahydrofolate cyclo-ligase